MRTRKRHLIAGSARLFAVVASASLTVALAAAEAGRWSEPVMLCSLQNREIKESSGIMESRRNPGVLWTHNDSDNPADLFATDRQGNNLGVFHVTGATNIDWEDVAPNGGKGEDAAIWIADTGDNFKNRAVQRPEPAFYRVWEPEVDPQKRNVEGRTMMAERYPFVYPDGPHDAETLLVDPKTQDIFLLTKEDSGISVIFKYPMPLRRNLKVTLERVGSVVFSNPLRFRGRNVGKLATGGNVSPDRTRIAIRTYTDAFEWTLGPNQTIPQALMGKPTTIPAPWMGQYESISYSLDGKTVYFTSEGTPCPLWEVKRK